MKLNVLNKFLNYFFSQNMSNETSRKFNDKKLFLQKKKENIFLAFKGQKKGSHHFSFLFLSLLRTLFCLIHHDKLIY